MLKDLVVSISLANVLFIHVWQIFLTNHSVTFPYYHWKTTPVPLLLATMFDVLLLSLVFFVGITLARRSRKKSFSQVARWVFLLMFVLAGINLLSIALLNPSSAPVLYDLIRNPRLLFAWQGATTIYFWLMILGLSIGWVAMTMMLHSLIYRRQQLVKLSVLLLLVLSPFVLITFTQAILQTIRYRFGEQFHEQTASAVANPYVKRRVLWLVFDEMDFRLGFAARPTSLQLPEFDRLRQESVFANNAYPPGGDTVLSLPALISGRLVSRARRTGPNELMLTFADGDLIVPWSTQPNVFSRARELGLNTGLVGWYHPYCRVIGNSLTECSWETTSLLFLGTPGIANLMSFSGDLGIGQCMLQVAGSPLQAIRVNLARRDPGTLRKVTAQEFNNIHQRAISMATDPNLQLVFVHYSIPHPPGIYDRVGKHFAFNSSNGYLDNFALADRVLRELRDKMHAAGLWESTAVVISSDHSLRADRVWKAHMFSNPPFSDKEPAFLNSTTDERVPFIVKLPRQTTGQIYEPPFNTVLSHDLLLALLSGEVSRRDDVVKWLDRHRTIGKSPYIDEDK